MSAVMKLSLGLFFAAFLTAMKLPPCGASFYQTYTNITEVVHHHGEPIVRVAKDDLKTSNVRAPELVAVHAGGSQATRSAPVFETNVARADNSTGILSADYFERLGLTEDATLEDIEYAHRLRVDVIRAYGGDDALMKLLRIEEAYDALKSPERLEAYKKRQKAETIVSKLLASGSLSDIADEVLVLLHGRHFEQPFNILVTRSADSSQYIINVGQEDEKNLLSASIFLAANLEKLFAEQPNVDSITMSFSQDVLGTNSIKIFSTIKETIVRQVPNQYARVNNSPYDVGYRTPSYCRSSMPVYVGGQCFCYSPGFGFSGGCD